MKIIFSIAFVLFTLWSYTQTTVQFSENLQFFDTSKETLSITIQVNNIDTYYSEKPIIVELLSNLEDPAPLGITTKKGIDKVIWPQDYTYGEEIHIPVNVNTLSKAGNFKLFLRKKGENEYFKISQNSHTVIVNREVVEKSYVEISSVSGKQVKGDFADQDKIELPFNIKIKGYVPNEADEAFANIAVRGMEEMVGLSTFVALVDAQLTDKILIEKNKTPEVFKKIAEILDSGRQLELEISDVTHNSQHQIKADPLNGVANFKGEKSNWADASYSFNVGTNFEFATDFKAKDIYYEVDISLLNLFKSHWGLRAGMYKNNTSRYLEDFMLRPTHYELVDKTVSDGKLYNLVQTGMAPSIATESLGFYFNIPYKAIESDNFKAFISPHFEIIERRETYTYEVIYENVLSTEITTYDLDFSVQRPLPNEVNSRYWESYLGLSFPMLYRNPAGDFQVTINPIFGTGYPGPYAIFTHFYTGIPDYDYIRIKEDNSRPLFFSAFQFNLLINPKESLGIKLGSDVRKYFGEGRKPIVSINLSTKLDFAQVFNPKGG